MYGLKQAPRACYARIDGYFHQYDFTRRRSEFTLYIMKKGNEILLVYLHVDDMIYMVSFTHMDDDFKTYMMHKFEMKD